MTTIRCFHGKINTSKAHRSAISSNYYTLQRPEQHSLNVDMTGYAEGTNVLENSFVNLPPTVPAERKSTKNILPTHSFHSIDHCSNSQEDISQENSPVDPQRTLFDVSYKN
jgi:hypothetical protein